MRRIIVLSMVTLDGVIQGPGAPKEDSSGGFKFGGWVAPFDDEEYGKVVQEELKPADYLLGRKTYAIWAAYWPTHGDFWPGINEGTKYVISRKLRKTDPMVVGWSNSVVIRTVADIRRLKKTRGADLQVWGSSELVKLLLKHDLVDELRLKIHPVLLGKGKKLFDHGAAPRSFTLTNSVITPKGVVMLVYSRAGAVKTGTIGA